MSTIAKILGLMLAGRSVADSTPMFGRLLSGIAAVVALAILSSILAGVLVVGMIYAAYAALVAHGLEPNAAMMIMAGVIIIMTGLMVNQLFVTIRRIKHIPAQVLVRKNPLAERATKLGFAFVDGFMSQPPQAPEPKL